MKLLLCVPHALDALQHYCDYAIVTYWGVPYVLSYSISLHLNVFHSFCFLDVGWLWGLLPFWDQRGFLMAQYFTWNWRSPLLLLATPLVYAFFNDYTEVLPEWTMGGSGYPWLYISEGRHLTCGYSSCAELWWNSVSRPTGGTMQM